MYYNLSGALKRRILLELKDSFSQHPVYNKIVPFIETKFSFPERPQFGIVLNGTSGSQVVLSADNFMGVLQSKVMLCYFGIPAFPLEWVREDQAVLKTNLDVMPTAPGVYFIEILAVPQNANDIGHYVIDPLLTKTQEPLLLFQTGIEKEAKLEKIPVQGTVRLYENGRYLMKEGKDYQVNYQTGDVTFLTSSNPGSKVTANYRYIVPSIGPISFSWNQADSTTLPGVILAFGKRAKQGDKVAVVVTQDRTETARVYGGKWELTFELSCISQDPIQMEEIADLAAMYIIADKKPYLESEGIEIVSVSMGGESEEPMDETGDIYSYMAALSIQVRADWEVHRALPFMISSVESTLTQGIANLAFSTLPVFMNRNNDFERIT